MLALNTFSIGGVATFYTALQHDVNWSSSLKLLGVILCVVWSVSLFLTAWALMPFQRSHSSSLIYYGSIAKLSEKTFLKNVREQTDEDVIEDLEKQVYHLSHGLTAKFNRLRWATFALLGSYVILIFTIITLLTNLK